MKKYFVISALGKDRPGIVNQLSQIVLDCGCNIEDSRMTVLGGEFAMLIMVSGHWSAITRLERQLPALEKKLELTILSKHTESRATAQDRVPYVVDVVVMDHPGIVRDVADFFASREINIEELSTWTYPAAHTGTPMFSLNMTVSIPASVHIGRLRDEFTGFCDNLNLDATLEPARQ
ncbi:MAG TPA: glycine cleavage system protein R [Candidatus Methylomirabilis sp.]|nr:glycine cleavage system protein R [Candidatus Methylomirabilis sp.]